LLLLRDCSVASASGIDRGVFSGVVPMNQIIGYGLLAWLIVIATAVFSIAFRRLVEHLQAPIELSPEPPTDQPIEQPLQLSPSERMAAAAEIINSEHHEKMNLIDSLPLPPEDKRALMNDEDERYANLMRNVLNRFATR
jgi:hypothetical protein